jgi:TolB-like protein
MISSPSSSSSRALPIAAAALAVAVLGGCRHAAPASATANAHTLKLAVFPIQNASGGKAPIKALTAALDAALALRGVEAVPRRDLDALLAEHRLRFTGGVDRPTARALREGLGVDAVLIPTLEQYGDQVPPKVAVAVRLVATDERPVVLWADSYARSGDDSPGLFKRGVVSIAADLERAVLDEVARRVRAWVATGASAGSCGSAGWRFGPRRVYRAPLLDDVGRRSVAVLPFTNETSRRSAEEVVLNQFVNQLARSGSFEVLDPGFVREQLLSHRIVLSGGVSIDAAMALLDLLDADLVVSGYVQVFEARAGSAGAPRVEFSSYALDRRTAELVWSAGSHGEGNAGVVFFNAGRVETAGALSCRMVQGVVRAMVGKRDDADPADDTSDERTANAAYYSWAGAVSARRFRAK